MAPNTLGYGLGSVEAAREPYEPGSGISYDIPAYQETSLDIDDEAPLVGAPVETINPLGTNVTFRSAILLPLSKMASQLKSLTSTAATDSNEIDCHGCIQYSQCGAGLCGIHWRGHGSLALRRPRLFL